MLRSLCPFEHQVHVKTILSWGGGYGKTNRRGIHVVWTSSFNLNFSVYGLIIQEHGADLNGLAHSQEEPLGSQKCHKLWVVQLLNHLWAWIRNRQLQRNTKKNIRLHVASCSSWISCLNTTNQIMMQVHWIVHFTASCSVILYQKRQCDDVVKSIMITSAIQLSEYLTLFVVLPKLPCQSPKA